MMVGATIQETATGRVLASVPGVRADQVVFSPDGRLLASRLQHPPTPATKPGVEAKDDFKEAVILAEAATGKVILRIESGWINTLTFSPDGRVLATSDHQAVRLWELATGKEILTRARHGGLPGAPAQAYITALAFFPDSRAIATGMMDGTILVWDLPPRAATARQLTAEKVAELWSDLAGDDAGKAYQAINMMAAAPARSLPYLKDHFRPAPQADPKRVEKLIADLDSEQFAERDAAAKELAKLGEQIEPDLRRVLKGQPSPEVTKRIESILARLQGQPSGESLRALRAIQVLEYIGTAEARDLLRKLADGAPARQTREAKMVLERMNSRR
jgi:WD40 repeat protein